jgi:hypothetical protein
MTADSAMARAALDLRWQAHLVAEQLLAPGLDAGCSLRMLERAYLDPLHLANIMLTMAQHQATNTTPAEPDVPGAAAFCGWCGATADLVDDSVDPATGERLDDPVWCCTDVDGCVDRRRERYPDDHVLIQAAQDRLNLATAAAAPALVALSSIQAACHQAAAQDQALALTAPRSGSGSHPAPPARAAAQASRWQHTLANPAHHQHLISRSRHPRG